MNILWHTNFAKHYKKRIYPYPRLKSRFDRRVRLFVKDAKDPILKDHQLVGEKRIDRAFWITGDIRVVYKIRGKSVEFYDVGSHNQVY